MNRLERRTLSAALLLSALAVGTACSSGGTRGVIPEPPEDVLLLQVQTAVFSPRCALSGCHIGIDAPFGLDLSAGETAGNAIDIDASQRPAFKRVDPGNAADSYIYMKVTGDARIGGDQMPAEGDPLNAGELQLLESWINGGAR